MQTLRRGCGKSGVAARQSWHSTWPFIYDSAVISIAAVSRLGVWSVTWRLRPFDAVPLRLPRSMPRRQHAHRARHAAHRHARGLVWRLNPDATCPPAVVAPRPIRERYDGRRRSRDIAIPTRIHHLRTRHPVAPRHPPPARPNAIEPPGRTALVLRSLGPPRLTIDLETIALRVLGDVNLQHCPVPSGALPRRTLRR